jgi:hypothetical protein
MTTEPALQKILEGVVNTEGEDKHNPEKFGQDKYH